MAKGELVGNCLLFCSGWILSLIALRQNTAVAVMMILVSLFFTAVAVLGIIMLKKVSSDGTLGPECPLGRTRRGFGRHEGTAPFIGSLDRTSALTPSLLLSSRSTLCTAGRAPASRKRRRSLPPGSSPTRRCAPLQPTLPRVPPPMPSGRLSQAGGPGFFLHVGLVLGKRKSKLHFHWIPVCLHQLSEAASSQLGSAGA